MINFRYVKYKNILSTGNAWTEIQLDQNKSTLIIGENGAGKSTILDSISFGLYGKPFRKINKPQLVNSLNQKNLEVEVGFRIGNKEYVVKRGIKPTFFEIWVDGSLLNQDAASRDYQAYLEENILKLNFKSFGQVVVLGSSTFVPFMQLSAKHRREVIEDLLDIQIFTTMNTLLKEKTSENKEKISEIRYEIDLLKNRIQSSKEHNESIRKMKESEVLKIKDRVSQNLKLIDTENELIEECGEKIDALLSTISDKNNTKKKHQEILDLLNKLDVKYNQISKEMKFYENHDNCPTCKQGIEHEFKEETNSNYLNKIEEIRKAKSQLEKKSSTLNERLFEISNIEDEISALNLQTSEHRANVKFAKNTLNSIKKELENAEQEVESIDTSDIAKMEDELSKHHATQNQLFDEKETLTIVSSMLKDGGIKTRIIKQYIPVMNKLINKYLAAMDFFVQFELDENFNETIKSRFRDVFSYSSFSEGEKARIDLALLLTWRAVSRLRNSVSTNLLIMDEVFDGSLDNEGTNNLFEIFSNVLDDTNLFVISHNKVDSFQEKFDRVIKFKKVKNFSTIE